MAHSDHTWARTGWWRVEDSDGSPKITTSNEQKARHNIKEGDTLLVQIVCTEKKWEVTD
ncbi:MAG: FtsX-like permease family protein [Phage AS32]|nr:MAG: FtsX-like permease family protein [Phage AS32]